jgi:hypothetical protein
MPVAKKTRQQDPQPVGMLAAAADPPVIPDEDDAGQTDSRDFVTFSLAGELFALPMDRVREIIRMPDTVKVPMTPRSLVVWRICAGECCRS